MKETVIMRNGFLVFGTAKLLPWWILEELTELPGNKNLGFVHNVYSEILFHLLVKLV